MNTHSFTIGQHLTLNNTKYWISAIDTQGNHTLNRTSDGVTTLHSSASLLQSYGEGELDLHDMSEEAKNVSVPDKNDVIHLPIAHVKRIQKRHMYVQNAIRDCGDKPTTKGLLESIEQTASLIEDPKPPSVTTVWNWWKRWYATHSDIRSLRVLVNKKQIAGKFCEEAMSILADVLDEHYLVREKPPKSIAWEIYEQHMERVNRLRIHPLKFPKRAQFYRILKEQNKYEEMKRREGKAKADLFFRTAKAGPDVYNILERVEVDHTKLDVFVIDETTGEVAGRPYITILVDYYSRMILGFEVGFEPPSELSVMRALKKTILPKSDMQSEHIAVLNKWLAYGLPGMLVCDNGLEFHSHQLRRVCLELFIEILFCPKLRPQYKGVVERLIGTLNREICHQVPGTTFSNIEERGDYPSEKKACITLEELEALILKWVVDVYSQRVHSGIKTTPAAKWDEGIKNHVPRLPPSPKALSQLTLKQVERSLTHKGIQLENLFYCSNELSSLRHYLQKKEKVLVRYNPDDLGSVWVFSKQEECFIEVHCNHFNYADGLTLLQHKLIQKKLEEKGVKHANKEALTDAKLEIFSTIKKMAKSKKLRDKQKASRIKKDGKGQDIETHLAKEKQRQSKRVAEHLKTLPTTSEKLPTITLS